MAAPNPSPLDRPSGLLPQHPPARAARWAGILLLLVAAATVAFAALVRLPEVVLAPFVLLPIEAADDLGAPINGELMQIAVSEGERVEAGQLLFELRNDGLRQARSELRQLTEQQQALSDRIGREEQSRQTALALLQAQFAGAEREVAVRRQQVAVERDMVERADRLGRHGALAEIELTRYRLSLLESEKDLSVAERALDQLRLQQQQAQADFERSVAELDSQRRLLAEQRLLIERQLADSRDDQRLIRAPYAAVILRLPARTVGSVVERADVLAVLARNDSPLKARLSLPDHALARLRPQQPVQLQLDAFPYQRHGSVAARLDWISPAAIRDDSTRGFRADALPRASQLALQAGMQGTARIEIERRTLFQRALDPLRGLHDRMR